MVYWYLIEETDERVIYEYYPENHKDKNPGIITIDRKSERIELTQPAEEDFCRVIKEEELRALYRQIAEIERANVSDYEEIITKSAGTRYWFYYDHAKSRIVEDYNNGIIKNIGMTAWY